MIRKRDFEIAIACIVLGIVLFFLTDSFSDSILSSTLRAVTCVLFVICIYMGKKEKSILNPYWLFSITPLSLMVYTERVSKVYLQKLTSETWGLAVINIVAFVFVLSISLRRPRIISSDSSAEENISISALKQNSVILLIVSYVPTVYKLIFGNVMVFTSVISLCVYAAIIMSLKTHNKRWAVMIIGLALLRFLLSFNKTDLIFILIVILIGIEKYYTLSARSKRKLMITLVCSGAFMLFVAFPLKTYVQDNGGNIIDFFITDVKIVYDYGKRIDWNGPESLKMPYMYLVTAWNNLQYVLQTQNTRTYGLWALKPILGYLQLSSNFDYWYQLIPYSNFNTFTYISVLFKDWGYWGSAVGSVFLGWFVAKMYTWYSTSTNAWRVSCYSLTAVAVLEMFFSNHFFGLSYPFTIVLLYFVFEKCMRIKG